MNPIRICVIGPESTGKTSLAEHLANSLGVPWVPEAARLYAERIGRELTRDDVEPIAREHIDMATRAELGQGLVVLDTDLMSTIVYGQHYYGFVPDWLDSQARTRLADLYLLCDVDVPWTADGIRDRPTDRASMLAEFRTALQLNGARIVSVSGTPEQRLTIALAATRSL